MSDTQNHDSRLRVLIADDVRATLHSTRLMLRLLPDVEIVATANNGREAIELSSLHEPDLVLIDINMPEVDGLTAIREIRRQRPVTACIIISAEWDDHTLQEARALGARDYLIKPFTTEELLDAVDRVGRSVLERRQAYERSMPLRRHLTAPLSRGQTTQLRDQRDAHLHQLAAQYIKERRTDDETVRVLEELAANPYCEVQWLRSLAMIYVIQKQWEKLSSVAERLRQYREPTESPGY